MKKIACIAGLWTLLAALPAPAAGPGTTPGAAFPKGHYAELDKLPDWGGTWVFAFGPPPPGSAPRETPQLKGSYLKDYQAWQTAVKEHQGLVPRSTSNCMPSGMPGVMAMPQYPMEFLVTPGRVTSLHEAWMQWRTIFTDGREHPQDWEGGIFGHSIGHWEAGTLVVDTVGIKTITELTPGAHHSRQLHIVERIHLLPGDPDSLVDEMTLDDPEALEKPFHQRFLYKRERDWNLQEFICAENDRNPVNEKGETLFH